MRIHIKDMYSEQTRDNMIVRITITLENISSDIRRTVDHLTHRLYSCHRVQGQNFKYLCKEQKYKRHTLKLYFTTNL